MIKHSTAPYLMVIAVSALLLLLSSQSIIKHEQHEFTKTELLKLADYDSRINQQIVQLHKGVKNNYGGLVAYENRMNEIMNGFSDSKSLSNLMSTTSTKALVYSLQQELSLKKDEIEIFKRENAVLKNTLHNLPIHIENILLEVSAEADIDTPAHTRIRFILNSIVTETLKFLSSIETEELEVQLFMEDSNSTLLSLLPSTLHDHINKIFTHTSLIINLHQSVTKSINRILSTASSDITRSMYENYETEIQQKQKKAQFYRLLFLALFLGVLIYLVFIFLKLQKTSKELNSSLVDLEFLKLAIDQHSIVSITDVKGSILYANDKFCDISQFSQEELLGQDHRIIKSHMHDNTFFKSMWKTIAKGHKWHGVFANKARDGSIYWVESTILPRLNNKGKPYQYIGIRTDITAQKEIEQRAAFLARFPSENPDPVLRVNNLGTLLYANTASLEILNHWHVQPGETLPDKWLVVCNRVLSETKQEDHEIKIEENYYSVLFTAIKNESYVNLYARNITQIKHAEKSLNYQATHDQLTNLYNRFAFESKLEAILDDAQFNDITSILLYIDLDQFKIVNDTCGHIAGDELLRQISNVFISGIRDSDFLARLGGDEFGVILGNCSLSHGEHIADKLLKAINNYRFLWEDKSFEIGASIGLVEINARSDSVVSLLGQADIACYAAKDSGRNRLQVFKQDQAISQRQHEMRWAIRIPKALAEKRFLLYAQLIKPLNTRNFTQPHYEVLIRLKDEKGNIVPPGAFIPAAERYGLMHSLDMHVILIAFQQLSDFNRNNPLKQIRISINLSGLSLGNPHILNYIPELIKKNDINPSNIIFEITETSAISNLTAAINFITTLKQQGCQFALDDFGSGLSSFAYLKNLPVDFLKIDGAFVKDILHDPIDAAMVESINQIGHVMNIKTIAEFVENEQIEQRLASMQVDYAQGFGIEKPRPLDEILLEQSADI